MGWSIQQGQSNAEMLVFICTILILNQALQWSLVSLSYSYVHVTSFDCTAVLIIKI